MGTLYQHTRNHGFRDGKIMRRAPGAQRDTSWVGDLFCQDTRSWDFQSLQENFGFTVALQVAHRRMGISSSGIGFGRMPHYNQKLRCSFGGVAGRRFPCRRFYRRESEPYLLLVGSVGQWMKPLCTRYFIVTLREQSGWMASPLGIRTDHLPLQFDEAVQDVRANLSDQDFIIFSCTMWAVWRTRNEVVYGNKVLNFATCRLYTDNACSRSLENSLLVCREARSESSLSTTTTNTSGYAT